MTEALCKAVDSIKYALVPYTRGRVLEIGPTKPFPHFITVGSEDVQVFADGSMDAVFTAILDKVEHPNMALKNWWRTIRTGGHLAVYGAHPLFEQDMLRIGSTWNMVFESEGLQVYRKGGPGYSYTGRKARPEKTACVVRYGGFGDMIQAASILPGLKKQGYHVTVNTIPRGHDILKADPNIDDFLIQDTDQVPNEELGAYFAYLRQKFTKLINLSGSVESSLLAMEGTPVFYWPKEARHQLMNHNYIEMTHAIAGVPAPYSGRFYPTPDEREWAAKERIRMGGKPVVLWSLAGSSVHKTWPHMDSVIARLLMTFEDVRIVLVGDNLCQLLERGWENEPRVLRRSGVWAIRETLTFAARQADIVIGTETGVMNAVGTEDVPKVLLLSHSTEENLSKHWKNCVSLAPPPSVSCYPCHQLHTSFRHCPRDDSNTAAKCQTAIPPDAVWAATLGILNKSGALKRVMGG